MDRAPSRRRPATSSRPRRHMHDGSEATLRQVIELYNRGGNANPNLSPKMKPLEPHAGRDGRPARVPAGTHRRGEQPPASCREAADRRDCGRARRAASARAPAGAPCRRAPASSRVALSQSCFSPFGSWLKTSHASPLHAVLAASACCSVVNTARTARSASAGVVGHVGRDAHVADELPRARSATRPTAARPRSTSAAAPLTAVPRRRPPRAR